MDPLPQPPTRNRRSTARAAMPRWLRIGGIVVLLALVHGFVGYLLTWISPVAEARFETITVRARDPLFAPAHWPITDAPTWTRQRILDTVAHFAALRPRQPAVLLLTAPAVPSETGGLLIIPEDAPLDDPSQWLRLTDLLEQFKACPSKQKLLVLDVAPPRLSAWNGHISDSLAQAIARDLDDVPDPARWVLCPSGDGEIPAGSAEWGETPLAHYLREGLLGRADGYDGARDGQVRVKELAAFVQARVARWSHRQLGEVLTPGLLGNGDDFALAVSPSSPPTLPPPSASPRQAWQTRDDLTRSGAFRASPVAFQLQQATLLSAAATPRSAPAKLERIGEILAKNQLRLSNNQIAATYSSVDAGKTFAEMWRDLQRQLGDAKATDAERLKKRFIEDARAKFTDAELDTFVFAQAQADARLDPGLIRLCDQLLHPGAGVVPRTAETLRIRQLADLAMRVEVHAWPRDAVDALLRATVSAAKAQESAPSLPGYVDLLDEPARLLHGGELRLWARGYASSDDARRLLTDAAERLERLNRLQKRRQACEETLTDTLAELPWFVEMMESLPKLRDPWESATVAATGLADALRPLAKDGRTWHERVDRHESRLLNAEKHVSALRAHRKALQAPFAAESLASLVRRCEAPDADGKTLREALALLSSASPLLTADRRDALAHAARALSKRLHERTIALDAEDDDAQRVTPVPKAEPAIRQAADRARRLLALLALAGVPEAKRYPVDQQLQQCIAENADSAAWCELGARLHELIAKQITAQAERANDTVDRERAAWLLPPWSPIAEARLAEISPVVADRQAGAARLMLWKSNHAESCASDYRGLNFETPGIIATRAFFARTTATDRRIDVRFRLTRDVDALSEQQPYAHVWLEVTREVPAGAFGTLELTFHRADDAWVEIAPASATLPALAASSQARKFTHKIPAKVMRLPKAERTGLPAPIGFLAEARFEGRSWHQLVAVPIAPVTRELQILVSADPDEPSTTVNEIRVRPGKVKQPHFIYVKNLTNRTHQVHVEIKAGPTTVFKSKQALTLDPDATRRVRFEEPATLIADLRGDVMVRVLDADRAKVLQERLVKVDVLSAKDYVRIAEAMYQPGFDGAGKWAAVVQSARPVAGPAIAAQLVLPMQRIPGLLGVGGGTMHVEVPARQASPRLLFAERLRLLPTANEEGPVYLHIDGVPRAFVYRTTFRRDGTPTQPRVDERPAVRLAAPPCMMAGIQCLVDVEVDNAPPGTKLEVALGRIIENGEFVAEATRDFGDAKKRRIDLEATRDALVFDATVSDWTATFDTRAAAGPRTLRARLVDGAGSVLAESSQSVVIDDSPPIARIQPTPAQVKQGSVLPLLVEAGDAESGVAQVTFFLGRPERGEIPRNAPRFKAIPVNREQTHWTVPLPVPSDRRGAISVSVQVVNHAGLATVDTVTFEITDREPGTTGLGQIQGRVLEGPRPQPNLIVTLFNDKGVEIARTRTQPDGSYRFVGLVPGRYRVVCVKPESQRRAVLDAAVEPDRPTPADLSLAL